MKMEEIQRKFKIFENLYTRSALNLHTIWRRREGRMQNVVNSVFNFCDEKILREVPEGNVTVTSESVQK